MKNKSNHIIRIVPAIICGCLIVSGCHRNKPGDSKPVKHTDTSKTQVAINTSAKVKLEKYGIKSGIVDFTTEMAGTKGKKMLYFDDYGKKEKEVFYDGDLPREAFVTVNGSLYKFSYKQKIAYRLGLSKTGNAYRFDWNEVPEFQKKQGTGY